MDFLAEIRTKAQEGIRNRLYKEAGDSKALLETLGKDIAGQFGGVVLPGPIKGLERATTKVNTEYNGDWYELKDVVRITIVVADETKMRQVQSEILKRCIARNRMGLIKNVETSAFDNDCGYSGLNLVVRLSNGRPGEIQVNTPELMYAKMKPASFRDSVGYIPYARIWSKYGLSGGYGHALYEIYRSNQNMEVGYMAASLSRMYYNCFRGIPQASRITLFKAELTKFRQKYGMKHPM